MNVGGIATNMYEFVYATCSCHGDVIGSSIVYSRFNWKVKLTINSMTMLAYAGSILVPIALPLTSE